MPRLERPGERRRPFWLDANNTYPARVPSGDSTDQTAAPNSHEQRVEVATLFLELQSHGSLAEQRFHLIVRMHGKRAGLRGPSFARLERICVALAGHHQFRSVAVNPLHLGR